MKTASERAREKNDEKRAWRAEDPANRGVFLLVEDQAHWDEAGIRTAEQLDHYLAGSMHYDVYKEKRGIRPRWIDYSKLTTEEIENMTEALLQEPARE